MELICAVAGATHGRPATRKEALVPAQATLVSVGASEQHKKAVGENGHVRIDLKGESVSLGGALAGELKSGERFRVTIERIK